MARATLGALVSLAVACSGQIAGSDGGAGSCSIPAGTYVWHATPATSSATCPSVPDQTVTYDVSTTFGSGSAAPLDAGAGCVSNVSSCTLTTSCDTTAGGVDVKTSFSLTYASDGTASGSETIVIVDGSGNTTSCTYDLSVTKS